MSALTTEESTALRTDGASGRTDLILADKSRPPSKRLILRLPFDRINWTTSSFLIVTLLLTLTTVPIYLYYFGLDWFQVALFFTMFLACGFSISIGYHRLFSHITFNASWPIRLLTLVFGAAAFENSALMWASEHRRHHKHVDHDDDPYCISKGFFHAHIGWLIFKLNPDAPYDNVADLQKDKLVCWQDRHVQSIAVLVSFGIPTTLGFLGNGWQGALGAFLIAGVARIVVLQHCTFLINSACHAIGRQPYSKKCTARDSLLLALFTMGEGYHNYHHEFQDDYRHGSLIPRRGLSGRSRKLVSLEICAASRQIRLSRRKHRPETRVANVRPVPDREISDHGFVFSNIRRHKCHSR